MKKKVTLSIVSHSQEKLISKLLDDCEIFLKAENINLNIVITHNIKESYYLQNEYKFSIRRRYNIKPHGFGFNHNKVFFEEKPDIFTRDNSSIIYNSCRFKDRR